MATTKLSAEQETPPIANVLLAVRWLRMIITYLKIRPTPAAIKIIINHWVTVPVSDIVTPAPVKTYSAEDAPDHQ